MRKIISLAERGAAISRSILQRIPAWTLLCATAAIMIITGLLRGEAGIQLAKAIRVCLECIGIG